MHVDIPAAELSPRETYRLLTATVAPRPIAWISSLDAKGAVNLAPFSFYTMLSTVPPLIGISISRHHGREKDTLVNVRERGEFVVNLVSSELLDSMHASSASYPHGVSEAAILGIAMVDSQHVRVPGVQDSPVRLECRLDQILPFGRLDSSLIVGEVLGFRVCDTCLLDGKPDMRRLNPVARLGGPWYGLLGERIHRPPPRVDSELSGFPSTQHPTTL